MTPLGRVAQPPTGRSQANPSISQVGLRRTAGFGPGRRVSAVVWRWAAPESRFPPCRWGSFPGVGDGGGRAQKTQALFRMSDVCRGIVAGGPFCGTESSCMQPNQSCQALLRLGRQAAGGRHPPRRRSLRRPLPQPRPRARHRQSPAAGTRHRVCRDPAVIHKWGS